VAAALVVPATGRTNRAVSIAATGFVADGTLVVSVDEIGVSASFVLDASGNLVGTPFTFTPLKEGVYTVTVTDGTTTKTSRIQIYSTT
jgi:hypothetical protein